MDELLFSSYCDGKSFYEAINTPLPESLIEFHGQALELLRHRKFIIKPELVSYTPKYMNLGIARTIHGITRFVTPEILLIEGVEDWKILQMLNVAYLECLVFSELGESQIIKNVGLDKFHGDVFTTIDFLIYGIQHRGDQKILSGLRPCQLYAFAALFELTKCVAAYKKTYISPADYSDIFSRLDSMERVMGSVDFLTEAMAFLNMAFMDASIDKIHSQEKDLLEKFIKPRQRGGAKTQYEHFYSVVIPMAIDQWQSEIGSDDITMPSEMSKILIQKYKDKFRYPFPEDLTGFRNNYLIPEFKKIFPGKKLNGRPRKNIEKQLKL